MFHLKILGFLDFRRPGISLFWGQFSPQFSPKIGFPVWFSKAGPDAGLDREDPIEFYGGETFRRRIQMGIDIRGGREVAVTKPLLDLFHGNAILQKK